MPTPVETTLSLLEKYDRPGPRYTSYPTAVEMRPEFGEADYLRQLAAADDCAGEPLSLYLHLPFCEERCLYCGCNVVITRKREIAAAYLERLEREIELVARRLPQRRTVSQLHWGGGTPTYLSEQQIERLYGAIERQFELLPEAEVAIEVDPRVTTEAQLQLLKRLGFNRISMGVQDFDPDVQAAVRRNQSEQQTRTMYGACRALGFRSINVDLIYGLPQQTPESFATSIGKVAELRPDRIALYSYAFVPWLQAHQRWIDQEAIPDPSTKLRLFVIARELLLAAGYEPIGMDHFALPEDEMAVAARDGRLGRNFMGYTVQRGSDMIGLGVSAISDVRGCLAQNEKKLSRYNEVVRNGKLPIARGLQVGPDDRIRREVITRLMCNMRLDCAEIEREFDIDFEEYFSNELAALRQADGPVQHGFLKLGPGRLEVVGDGRLFVRNICMAFDRYLKQQPAGAPIFSRTV